VPPRKLTFVADLVSLVFELPLHRTDPQELSQLLKLVIAVPDLSDDLRTELRMRLDALT
jgi:hypothetical protein